MPEELNFSKSFDPSLKKMITGYEAYFNQKLKKLSLLQSKLAEEVPKNGGAYIRLEIDQGEKELQILLEEYFEIRKASDLGRIADALEKIVLNLEKKK